MVATTTVAMTCGRNSTVRKNDIALIACAREMIEREEQREEDRDAAA